MIVEAVGASPANCSIGECWLWFLDALSLPLLIS